MLHHWQYEQARRDAEFHVQVAVHYVQNNVQTPGSAHVDAEVVRVFRGGGKLRLGDPVHFVLSVLTGDEDPLTIPVGGTLWMNYHALQTAQYLEVFLDGLPPECAVVLWQYDIIDEPTKKPTMDVPAESPQQISRSLRRCQAWGLCSTKFGGERRWPTA